MLCAPSAFQTLTIPWVSGMRCLAAPRGSMGNRCSMRLLAEGRNSLFWRTAETLVKI